ncbi:hypothetical protein NL676_016894 [Syzygium grande]|nr:hypothetical protein NL676_016894 [Syzygium grande]
MTSLMLTCDDSGKSMTIQFHAVANAVTRDDLEHSVFHRFTRLHPTVFFFDSLSCGFHQTLVPLHQIASCSSTAPSELVFSSPRLARNLSR